MSPIKKDYSSFDHPSIQQFLFNPRPEWGGATTGESFQEILIPVAGGEVIGSRFYGVHKSAPVILFFHGNGEIVEDYHDLAPMYGQMGVNFFPVDYRGYGKSSGSPSVSTMLNDSHDVFNYVITFLKHEGYTGPLVVMGRSLGSASALEIADSYSGCVDGLIIESGFAFAIPLLQLICIDTDSLGLDEKEGFSNYSKVTGFRKPTLIIHAEHDHIIPFSDGKYLYDNSPAEKKHLLMIAEADHNNIFAVGLQQYLKSVQLLITLIEQN